MKKLLTLFIVAIIATSCISDDITIKKADLKNILEYHTYVGVLKTEYMQDGQEFEQVNGGKVKITKNGDKVLVNGSEIVASIVTSNGIIHVINDVLLPK